MRRIRYIAFLFMSVALLVGCGSNLYFGTATSVGLNVSGTSKLPNKISFAYDRGEVAIVPDDSAGNPHSVFGSLDSEWTWIDGFYVTQNFATGEAADLVAKESCVNVNYTPPASPAPSKPLVFTTGTTLGINIEFGQTASAPMSFLVGYRRAEMTLMPDVAGKEKIDPVFADISIASTDKAPVNVDQLPLIGGVRIKQRFAVGTAAVYAAGNPENASKLRSAVYGDSTLKALDEAKMRFDKEGAIMDKFDEIGPDKQKAYLKTLNEAFGRIDGNKITTDNFQKELGKFKDIQIDIAVQQIKSL